MYKKIFPLSNSVRNYSNGKGKYVVVMVRHGQSEYNEANLFNGWFNSKLSGKGKEEAKWVGQTFKTAKLQFDVAFTSVLSRTVDTLAIIMQELGLPKLPVKSSWRLNARHFGDLTSYNKAQTIVKYGSKQVKKWQTGFTDVPPLMMSNHKNYDSIKNGSKDAEKDIGTIPLTESIEMTLQRTLLYWNDVIVPEIKGGKKVLIVAHGTNVKGLIKNLDKISDEDVFYIKIPPAIPVMYKLDENLKPIANGSMIYLGDPKVVQKAIDALGKKRAKKHPKEI